MTIKMGVGRIMTVVILFILATLVGLYFYIDTSPIKVSTRVLPRVAHAGGGYKGLTYTNSIEALDTNAKKFELFEVDFSFTSDGQLVCIHDWEESAKLDLGKKFDTPPTFAEFVGLLGRGSGYTNCTLDTLAAWLRSHPNKRVVTDVKGDNLRALRFILDSHPEMRDRVIPQIYHPNEYSQVKKLGFRDVILTLYRCSAPMPYVVFRTFFMDLYAVTIPIEKAYYARYFKKIGIPTYVHTINSSEGLNIMRQYGATEIYTDWLIK
jgi:glycerophosphoryl diester phosphodiesterase